MPLSIGSVDDEGDDDSDSLLISPAVDRVLGDHSIVEFVDGRRRFTAVTSMDQRYVGFETEANDSTFEGANFTAEEDAPINKDSLSLAHSTPAKSKFNYATAMEELEFLAPTPATAKKEQRRRTRIEIINEDEEDGSPPPSPLASAPAVSVLKASTSPPDGITIPTSMRAPLTSTIPNPTNVTRFDPSINPPVRSFDNALKPIQTDCISGTSVFRQPCIRKSNSVESLSLELNLGHPANESYDINEANNQHLIRSVGCSDHWVKDSDLSMEVEKHIADADYDGLILEDRCRVDNVVNMKEDGEADATEFGVNADNSDNEDLTKSEVRSDFKATGDVAVPPLSSVHPAAGSKPWDIMDSSDDSEEDATAPNRQSDYVEKMNESIASYFSSHGGTIQPEHDANTTFDSLEFSADLDDSLEEEDEGKISARLSIDENRKQLDCYEDNVNIESLETPNGTGHDGSILNQSADDASHIDVEESSQFDRHAERLTDEGESKDNENGSQTGVESTNEDVPESEPIVDLECAPSVLGESDSLLVADIGDISSSSLLAADIGDIRSSCGSNSTDSAIDNTTCPTKVRTTDGNQDTAEKCGDIAVKGSPAGITSAIADKKKTTLEDERRDEDSQPSANGGAGFSLLQIDSEDQSESGTSSDSKHDVDVTHPSRRDGRDVKILSGDAFQIPSDKTEKNYVDLELSLSLGSFSDELSPILKCSSTHNGVHDIEHYSRALQIELANVGDMKLSFDDEGDHEYRYSNAAPFDDAACFTERSDMIKMTSSVSDLPVPIQKQAWTFPADDPVDSVGNSSPDRSSASIDELAEAEPADNAHNPVGSSTCTENKPSSAVQCSENKRASIEDLSSYQQSFNSTSNAFLERLREGAEIRKREVTRARHSMERKEQILSEEKNERVQKMSMPSVDEESSTSPPLNSIPKALRPGRMLVEREDDPYKSFKATPLPATSYSTTSMISLGSKRKSSTVFRPVPTQTNSNVMNPALNTKPPKRLLSGEDASNAKEMSQRKRIQEEEAKIRRESIFKARPLPATTRARSFAPLAGEDLVDEMPVHSGKENIAFIPRSSHRAEERKLYDIARAEREQKRRLEQIEQRNRRIEQTKSEINELKKFLR